MRVSIRFSDIEDFLLKIEPPKNLETKNAVQLGVRELTLTPKLMHNNLVAEWEITKIK